MLVFLILKYFEGFKNQCTLSRTKPYKKILKISFEYQVLDSWRQTVVKENLTKIQRTT